MQAPKISTYGVDCTVYTTLPEIQQVLRSVRRNDPDLVVFYAPGMLTAGFLNIVNDMYASGCAVMLTSNKSTTPAGTTLWFEKLVG